jgi:predicted dinucleotide-binding enzyme
MKTKQTIALIGAGSNVGTAIAKGLSRGNYRLLLCAAGHPVDNLAQQIKDTDRSADVETISCTHEASWEADIIILAMSENTQNQIAEKIREVSNQKIVVSISDALTEMNRKKIMHEPAGAAIGLQKLLPQSKVVKTFRTSFDANFTRPVINGIEVDTLIAGNDIDALHTVMGIVRAAGFNPFIAGDLSVCHSLENMQLYSFAVRHKIQQQLLKNRYSSLN